MKRLIWLAPILLTVSQTTWASTQAEEAAPSAPAAQAAQNPVERELGGQESQVALYGEAVSALSLMGLHIVKENERVSALHDAWKNESNKSKPNPAAVRSAELMLRREISEVCLPTDAVVTSCFERWQAMNGITLNAISKSQSGARVSASAIKEPGFAYEAAENLETPHKPFVPTAKDLDQMVQAQLKTMKDGKVSPEQWRRSMQGFIDSMPMASNPDHKKARPEDYYKVKLVPRDPGNTDPQAEKLAVYELGADGKPVVDKERYETALKGLDEGKNSFYKNFVADMKVLAKNAADNKDPKLAPQARGADRFVQVRGDKKNYYRDEDKTDLTESQRNFMTSRNQIANRMKQLKDEEKKQAKNKKTEDGRVTASASKDAAKAQQASGQGRESFVAIGSAVAGDKDLDPSRQDMPVQEGDSAQGDSSYSLYLDQTDLFGRVQNYLQFPVEAGK